MNISRCFPQKGAKMLIAIIFIIGAVGFTVTGFTVLPIFGFIFAIPFAAGAIYFIRVHLNDQCQIEP